MLIIPVTAFWYRNINIFNHNVWPLIYSDISVKCNILAILPLKILTSKELWNTCDPQIRSWRIVLKSLDKS